MMYLIITTTIVVVVVYFVWLKLSSKKSNRRNKIQTRPYVEQNLIDLETTSGLNSQNVGGKAANLSKLFQVYKLTSHYLGRNLTFQFV